MGRVRYSAIDIANWFLWKNKVEQIENVTEYDDYEVYESLTHLKLQKLVYFAQGIYLAFTGDSLFKEKILAWEHGPVIREVYDAFKEYKRNDITKQFTAEEIEKIQSIEEDEDASGILNTVYKNFGVYTAWQLRQLSHIPDGLWEQTVSSVGMDREIKKDLMKDYFKKYIKENG